MGKPEGPLSVRPMLIQPIGAIYKPDADKWRNVVSDHHLCSARCIAALRRLGVGLSRRLSGHCPVA